MLEGIIRESIGKGSAKKLRRDGYLIANIYGKGLKNINCAFKKSEFIKTVREKKTLAFDVKIGDKELKAVVQEYQKDPVTSDLIHVDLIAAQPNVVTYYNVPVEVVGTPVGLKNKGVLIVSKKRIRVKGSIENIPNKITIDVAPLDVGDAVLIRDIELPNNVVHTSAGRVAVAGVIKAK